MCVGAVGLPPHHHRDFHPPISSRSYKGVPFWISQLAQVFAMLALQHLLRQVTQRTVNVLAALCLICRDPCCIAYVVKTFGPAWMPGPRLHS